MVLENQAKQELTRLINAIYNDKSINTNHEIIDLVEESQMPVIISKYLSSEYLREKMTLSLLRTQTDVLLTEKSINRLVASFSRNIGNNDEFTANREKCDHGNLSFDFGDGIEKNSISGEEIDIPPSFKPLSPENVMSCGSEYIPLIFVALVIRSYLGFETSIGIEITETINDHIVNDDNKKYTNNVSRALRSNSLIKQKWLLIRTDLHPKFRKFSLSSTWQSEWIEIFGEEPPEIEI
ncbi:hypothetical protein EU461_16765 [Salmonella enterica subsp. enterica serovar Papuana]|nr:hypothetical protein [Salmonella enterica subsp. enterica serovar Papuana]